MFIESIRSQSLRDAGMVRIPQKKSDEKALKNQEVGETAGHRLYLVPGFTTPGDEHGCRDLRQRAAVKTGDRDNRGTGGVCAASSAYGLMSRPGVTHRDRDIIRPEQACLHVLRVHIRREAGRDADRGQPKRPVRGNRCACADPPKKNTPRRMERLNGIGKRTRAHAHRDARQCLTVRGRQLGKHLMHGVAGIDVLPGAFTERQKILS